ncbi:hypothetical protein RHSIM_Rhsim04G0034600 [Rhododendron simsii]|uniref:non-specific serine/threonine protein kinase n=1 Tax=Rhododendron simsii TaxID=118357 RepID=A0A834LQC1_RHOSS|nr:hypothetical protein RHSIM_Rhsim04G0034600 [Rhododendron simsii]
MQNIESTESSGHAPTGIDETHLPQRYGMNFDICRSLEFNQLSGPIPRKLGSLPLLWKLHLTSNNFSEELPKELANLTNLQEFRIGDNHFTGKIPDFIKNWVNLTKLVILGSGLEGPIPPGIGLLTKLSDLRISDLNGSQPSFPSVNLTSLRTLILRSCNINGPLPEYLGTMTNLKLLDLSFNNLSGKIPDNFIDLSKIDYMYLTGNLLSGPVLPWMMAPTSNALENNPCLSLRGFPCNKKWRSSFHINCGGEEVSLNGKKTYEDDRDQGGASNSNYRSTTNWAFSSTGNFMEDNRTKKSFTLTNLSILSMKNSKLYMDARISPISLTYYGFCLVNGNYTINLHFAEIMFDDGKTYSSLGRRIFDIYIQGMRVQKDFNIVDAAGGIGKEIIMNYTANVTDGTLEIRLYWAGKGTTGLPVRGVYGPLISAISVQNPDYKPSKGISTGAVVGIVAAVAFAIILLLGILWWRGFLTRKDTMDQDGTLIAVKQLSSKSKQGNREFVNEIGMISALQHPYLVKLYGCCIEGNQLLLVYEYMENNSLARALFEDDTHISTRIAGTYGYMAPEYAMRGYLTDKADVYSFGIVTLEIVSGRSNTSYKTKEFCLYLLDWALVLKQKGDLMELVDPKLGSDFNKTEVTVMINVALLCANVSPAVRPAMSSVVSMLEGRTVPETSSVPDPDASNEQMKLKGMMIELQKSLETDTSDQGQIEIVSTDGPYTASSASAGDLYPYTASSASASDLYPLNWDSKVLENQYIR